MLVPVPATVHDIPLGLQVPVYVIVSPAATPEPIAFSVIKTVATPATVGVAAVVTAVNTLVVYVPEIAVEVGIPNEALKSAEVADKVASLQATPKEVRAGDDKLTASDTFAFTV